MASNDLFLAIKNCVVRIRRSDGSEVWRSQIVRRSSSLITIAVEKDTIYASANGILFALDPNDGRIKWENDLPRLGKQSALIAIQPD